MLIEVHVEKSVIMLVFIRILLKFFQRHATSAQRGLSCESVHRIKWFYALTFYHFYFWNRKDHLMIDTSIVFTGNW